MRRPGTEKNANPQQRKRGLGVGIKAVGPQDLEVGLRGAGAVKPAAPTKCVPRGMCHACLQAHGIYYFVKVSQKPYKASYYHDHPPSRYEESVGNLSVVKQPFWGLNLSGLALVYGLHCHTVLKKAWGRYHSQRQLSLSDYSSHPPAPNKYPPFHAHLVLFVFPSFL